MLSGFSSILSIVLIKHTAFTDLFNKIILWTRYGHYREFTKVKTEDCQFESINEHYWVNKAAEWVMESITI